MTRPATLLTTVVCVTALAALSGCGSDGGDEAALPEGSVVLRENIPTDVEGVDLVGVNITEDGGAIASPELDGGRAEAVEEGQSLQVGGLALTVVAIRDGDGDEEAPGGGDGYIAVTVD